MKGSSVWFTHNVNYLGDDLDQALKEYYSSFFDDYFMGVGGRCRETLLEKVPPECVCDTETGEEYVVDPDRE